LDLRWRYSPEVSAVQLQVVSGNLKLAKGPIRGPFAFTMV
jgi:hypothetical protein